MSPDNINYIESIERAKKNQKAHELNEAVYNAARSNDLPSVKYYIELGASLHLLEGEEVHPYNDDELGLLHVAVKNKNLELIKYLLSIKDVKVDAKNRKRQTPLHLAVYDGNLKIINLLINAGADIEAKEDYQDTPLCWAVYQNQLEALKLLVEKGAKINILNINHNTPLHWACYRGHTEIARFLIENGADYQCHMKNDAEQTPLMSAIENGHIETVFYFMELEKQKAIEALQS